MGSKIFKITKNTLVGFFIIVFILGFFSKSIVNFFLPKVQITSPIKTTFSRTLNIEGMIVPKETIKVRLAGDVIVDGYLVNVGDEVKKGDPLFKINKIYGMKLYDRNVYEIKLNIKKEELKLNKLRNNTYEIDEKNISLLEENIKNMKEEIQKLEKLYDIGAITVSELEDKKHSLNKAQVSLEIERLLLKEKIENNSLDIKDALYNIEKLNKEISDIEKINSFYSNISDDGIYYSEENGVVLTTNKTDILLNKDTILIELGVVKNYDSVKYIFEIPQKYYVFVNNASMINIEANREDIPTKVMINKISKVVDNNTIRVEGDFKNHIEGSPVIYKEIRGTLEKKFTSDNTVPKIAVIPYDKFKAGEEGYVYIVLEEKGILGIEYIVKKIDITITGVGDRLVGIEGIDMYDNLKIITNPSYKIQDGVKVLVWE